MDNINKLAEALYSDNVSLFSPTGEGLFDNNIHYPHITEEKRHYWHKVWLFLAKQLLKQAEADSKLIADIATFLEHGKETKWVEIGWALYKKSAADYPEVPEALLADIRCCKVANGE